MGTRDMRKRTTWLLAILAGAVAVGFVVETLQRDGAGAVAVADIEAGKALYAQNCASCHGAGLEGQPDWQSPGADGILPAPPHDETGHTWHHDDALLFTYTRLGGEETLKAIGVSGVKSGMPAFGDLLSDAEIADILAFIRSTWPERMQKIQRQRSEAQKLKGN